MVFTQCDSCGKTFTIPENRAWNQGIYYFTNLDFCSECYKKLEGEWEDSFHKCNHDMKIFAQKKVEIARSMCAGSKKAKKSS